MKRAGWIYLALTALWLGCAHLAPYLPPTNLLGVLFGLAPPGFLMLPPALAAVGLLVAAARRRNVSRNLWLSAVLTLAAFPLLSFQPNRSVPGGGEKVRVMTFNVNLKSRQMPELLAFLKGGGADVVFLQENKGGEDRPAAYLQKNLPGWHLAEASEVAILSRWPQENVMPVPLRAGDPRRMLSVEILGPRRFRAVTMHWLVPQFSKGLRATLHGAAFQEMEYRATVKEVGRSPLPLVLGGDFNNPPRHILTRRLSERMEDCFSTAGFGPGWTYPSRFPLVRIDHLYVANGFETREAEVGPALGSDHRPLLATLAFVP